MSRRIGNESGGADGIATATATTTETGVIAVAGASASAVGKRARGRRRSCGDGRQQKKISRTGGAMRRFPRKNTRMQMRGSLPSRRPSGRG
ncbi:hypothetical protein BJX96DRAFT_160570 [Aspergillus floccosus]